MTARELVQRERRDRERVEQGALQRGAGVLDLIEQS